MFPSGPFVDVTVEDLDTPTRINQRAYSLCAQQAARSMMSDGGGSIVNVASITWHGDWGEMSPYVATKGAIVAMTRALATELGLADEFVGAGVLCRIRLSCDPTVPTSPISVSPKAADPMRRPL